jgi:hypothetical protein
MDPDQTQRGRKEFAVAELKEESTDATMSVDWFQFGHITDTRAEVQWREWAPRNRRTHPYGSH